MRDGHVRRTRHKFALAALVLALLVGCARPLPPLELRTLPRTKIETAAVTFELPGLGWIATPLAEDALRVTRAYGARTTQGVTVRRVPVPAVLEALSPSGHAARYFDAERRAPRRPLRWDEFHEDVRRIAGRLYPIMTRPAHRCRRR